MATKKAEVKLDKRPRFGWCADLDNEPQRITEQPRLRGNDTPVMVIPLPFNSAKMRAEVKKFAASLWAK